MPKGDLKSGCKTVFLRLEKRLGRSFWRVQSSWSAFGGEQRRLAGLIVTPKKGSQACPGP